MENLSEFLLRSYQDWRSWIVTQDNISGAPFLSLSVAAERMSVAEVKVAFAFAGAELREESHIRTAELVFSFLRDPDELISAINSSTSGTNVWRRFEEELNFGPDSPTREWSSMVRWFDIDVDQQALFLGVRVVFQDRNGGRDKWRLTLPLSAPPATYCHFGAFAGLETADPPSKAGATGSENVRVECRTIVISCPGCTLSKTCRTDLPISATCMGGCQINCTQC